MRGRQEPASTTDHHPGLAPTELLETPRCRGLLSLLESNEAGALRDACKHARTNFFLVVECEYKIRPALTFEYAMRTTGTWTVPVSTLGAAALATLRSDGVGECPADSS